MSVLDLKVPPPLVALIAAGLMWLLGNYIETPVIDVPYKSTLCYLLVGVGLLIDVFAIRQFGERKQRLTH